jgi:transposase
MTTILGIDIAKQTFDATLWDEQGQKKRRAFKNTASGHKQLCKWVSRYSEEQVHACMESTSVYWEALADYLYTAGYRVSVVNPARIKGYAMSQMRRSKTDPLDADIIADFCRTQQPDAWKPPTPEQRKLRALVRHHEALKKSRIQQTNRLSTCGDDEVRASIETILQTIDQEIEQVKQRIEQFFDDHPDQKEKRDLIVSIKGLGIQTATRILAEMYDLEHYQHAKAAAADAGITASHYRSGVSVRRRSKISRMGKASIRGALYFPAISAIRHNPIVKRLAERLEAKGKQKAVIRVAAMRKLMHLVYGVLKNRKPFDPNHDLVTC